jgi:NAD(P)H-quinone oxidoreductase subunit 5
MTPLYAAIGVLLSIYWSPGITRLTGPRPAAYVNILMSLMAFCHSAIALPEIWNQPAREFEISWLDVSGLHIGFPVQISAIGIGATVLVTGLNVLAQIYAIRYMEMDWGLARFFTLMALFEAGMCTLLLCNSLFFSYVILEILTLATYLIVGFWYAQPLVVTGARDAFLTKRVGDLFLLMGVIALYPLAGTWNFSELADWAQTATLNPTVATLLGLTLLAGPMGKCAQFPLHLWLDEAMEGPIPASILRNAVVVQTGSWVLIKLAPVLALSPIVLTVAIAIGAVSAVGGALISIGQVDVKRVLSYLTTAYMGLVFIAVGTLQIEAAWLLMLTYAVAISLLFMSVGSIISNNITQDITQMGGLWSRRPITGLAFIIGALTLIAAPPFGSFWPLIQLADGLWEQNLGLVALLLIVNGLTAFSLIRAFGLMFAGEAQPMTVRSPENLWPITVPMTLLAGFTLHLPLVLQSLSLLPDWATLNSDMALLLVWSSLFAMGLGGILYIGNFIPKPVTLPWPALQNFIAYDFYTAKAYRFSIVFGVDTISKIANWIDRFIVDGTVHLFGFVTILGGQGLKYSTSGQSQFYLLTVLLGVALAVFLTLRF